LKQLHFAGFPIKSQKPNKALHLTAIPLRSIAAGELGRYNNFKIVRKIWKSI
jgi:hypothetical protein